MDRGELDARVAERHNRRVAEALPLFAADPAVLDSVARRWTADSVAQAREETRRAMDEFHQAQAAVAASVRNLVAALVSPEELAALDAYRARTYPASAAYSCDFWRKQLKRLQEEDNDNG